MFGSGNPQSFSFGESSTGTRTTATPSSTAATGNMANKPGGFTFGPNTGVPQTTGAATTGFSFGTAGTNPAPASGFTFGNTGTAATCSTAPAAGSTFGNTGAAATSTTAPASGFTFGNTGAAATTSTAPASGFAFGNTGAAATTSTAPSTGFNLQNVGTAANSSTAPVTGFSLGNAGTGATSTAAAPQGTATPGGFSFATTLTVTGVQAVKPLQSTTGTTSTAAGGSTGFGFGTLGGAAKPSTTTTSGTAAPSAGFSFNTATTTSTPGGLLGTATTSAVAASTTTTTTGATVGFSIPVQSTAFQPATSTAATGLAPAATTSTAAAAVAPSGLPQAQITYQQLEENINKWMADLEKQERDFLQQATQVNAWDRLLVENGEKITGLNSDMERVKIDQQKLDHELDFIKSQQRELEELLVPLEKSVDQQTSNFQHHADLERDNTYQLAENVDAQLKRMVVDLKEIIDHLNTNSSQDNTDPIQQITKILNAHMDALQWVDQNTALLGRKVEDVAKQMEVQRKEQERNFRLVYN